jgi:hypothetical protein
MEKWGTAYIETVDYGGIAYRIVRDNCFAQGRRYS